MQTQHTITFSQPTMPKGGKSAKRQHDADPSNDSDAKRIRSNDGSPAQAPKVTQDAAGDNGTAKSQIAARMAAMKAKIAAAAAHKDLTSIKQPTVADATSIQQPTVPDATSIQRPPVANADPSGLEAKRAEAQRKIAEVKAKMAARRGQTSTPTPVARPQSDVQQRIAEVRAKAAEYAKQREKAASNPAAQMVSQRTEGAGARGGLGIGLHPSLLAAQEPASTAKGKSLAPKFSTTKGNRAASPVKVNPYLAAPDEKDEEAPTDNAAFDPKLEQKARQRKSKALAFAPHGKYIAQAAALKQQAKLEDLKKRLALEAKKTAIEEASDKSFLVPAPPEIEWWDESLFPDDRQAYDDWQKYARIETADSVITRYVQHPVLIAAAQDKLMPAPKPMMLTQKETKKLRRQRRMADMKEEQAKIRLGLIEAPAPKVKRGNMMRVFGEQAVKDPTAVEARVNREIAQRAADHERANEERKLTKDERAEKLKGQQAQDEAKGVKMAVFRVDNLSSGKHRYQIDVNAKQNSLTGVVILHPEMNLVVVEGGVHSVNNYKKLMLNRIKWSENTVPLSSNSNPTFTAAAMRETNREPAEGPSAVDTWLNPLTERGELKDLSENKCLLVWEGDERQRSFRKWGSRVCVTDGEARDTLARSKMENMWATAKGTTE